MRVSTNSGAEPFFHSMVGGVATAAAVRTWPFRVYSFPTELRLLSIEELKKIYVERAMASIFDEARKFSTENFWIPAWSVPKLLALNRSTDPRSPRSSSSAPKGVWVDSSDVLV
jgi:hypothetical protein